MATILPITGLLGHPLDMGVFTLSGAPYSSEYFVRLRLGSAGSAPVVEYSSASPPAAPAVFEFDRTLGEVSIRVAASDVDGLGEGQHLWQLDVVSEFTGVQPSDIDSTVGTVELAPEIG